MKRMIGLALAAVLASGCTGNPPPTPVPPPAPTPCAIPLLCMSPLPPVPTPVDAYPQAMGKWILTMDGQMWTQIPDSCVIARGCSPEEVFGLGLSRLPDIVLEYVIRYYDGPPDAPGCVFHDEYVDRTTWIAADVPFVDGIASPGGCFNRD